MKIRPLKDLVLIQADPPVTKTASGILVSEQWKTLPLMGEVLAIGPMVTKVKVGERVLFDRYATIILEGDQRLAKEGMIHATV